MVAGKMFLAARSKKQSAYYKRAYRKRRKYVHKRAVNRGIIKGVMPYAFNNVMTWSSGQITSDIGSFFSFGVRANKLDDPGITVSLLPPRWFAEMGALYDIYRVYAVKVTLTIEDTEPNATAETSSAFIGLLNRLQASPANGLEIQEKPRLYKQRVIPRNSGYAKLTFFRSIYKIEQETRAQIDLNEEYQGSVTGGSTPLRLPSIYVGAYTMDDAGSTTYRFRVQVSYYTRWTTLKDV